MVKIGQHYFYGLFYLMASLVRRLLSTVSDGRIVGELGRILEEARKPNGF